MNTLLKIIITLFVSSTLCYSNNASSWKTFSIEKTYSSNHNYLNSWIYFRYNSVRLGLLTLDAFEKLDYFGKSQPKLDERIPLITFGIDLIGNSGGVSNHSVLIDAGFNFKASQAFTYGGLFLGLKGKHGRFLEKQKVLEYQFAFKADQAFYIPDRARYDCSNFDEVVTGDDIVRAEACAEVRNATTPEINYLLQNNATAYEKDLYDQYQNKTNALTEFSISSWFPLIPNIWFGATCWSEKFMYQESGDFKIAGGFYVTLPIHKQLNAELKFNVGFGSGDENSSPISIKAETAIHFGRALL